jgi:hypothetical protein
VVRCEIEKSADSELVRIPGHVNNHSGDVNNGFRADVNNRFRGQVNENFALPGIFIHIPELISQKIFI